MDALVQRSLDDNRLARPKNFSALDAMSNDAGRILEVNEPMNRAMEGMGGTIVKRYRLYEKPL